MLFSPIGVHAWKLGFVLTVWRPTAKAGCSKPSALPLPISAVKCFRAVEMSEVPNAKPGTFQAGPESNAMVVPSYRMGLVLRVRDEDTKRGVDGLRVVLDEAEMKMVNGAKKWATWNVNQDVRIRKRKASEKPAVILLDDDHEGGETAVGAVDEPVSKKMKAGPEAKMTVKSLGLISVVRG